MSDSPIIELDSVDSTNNYAMRLIDADKAQPGLTICARRQSAGKGQRGRVWVDAHGESLLMSIIVRPGMEIRDQFLFSVAKALAVAKVLQKLNKSWNLRIKWPNDIIINDKKAGGILIENILRGSNWTHSIIGIGVNVNQERMPEQLPNSTSLRAATGKEYNIREIREQLRLQILANTVMPAPAKTLLKQYNDLLFRKGEHQAFSNGGETWVTTIRGVKQDGALEVQLEDGTITQYYHGQVVWEW
ncbi:MAG: biotin--[acetyl-CoA-carboxylase] ligase [Bacteroidota bacterium]